jgi:hypothetical protein
MTCYAVLNDADVALCGEALIHVMHKSVRSMHRNERNLDSHVDDCKNCSTKIEREAS